MNEKTAYPLSWPDGWKRISPLDRAYAKFERIQKEYRAPSSPGGQGWYARTRRDLTIADGLGRVLEELRRMGIDRDDVIISTNVKLRLDGLPASNKGDPADPGAAVYWVESGKPMRCMAIDRYTRVADNLAAIAATLDAMRAIERHGGAEILNRAFTGFAALPEKASSPWRDILELSSEKVTKAEVDSAFRRLAHQFHPDKESGNADKFNQIVRAREAAYLEVI